MHEEEDELLCVVPSLAEFVTSGRMRKRAGPRTNATARSSTGSGLGIGLRDSPRTYGAIGKAYMSPDLPITERAFDADGDCAGIWLRAHSEMMLGVAKEDSIASVLRSRSPSRLHKRQRAAYSVAVIYTRYGQLGKCEIKRYSASKDTNLALTRHS